MADEIWSIEVFEFSLGQGVSKIVDGPVPVFGTLEAVKEVVRNRMASIVENNLPGHAVRLLNGSTEVYLWTKDDDALLRTLRVRKSNA